MKASNKAIELIKKFEGFSPKKYKCPAGKDTIGYGCRISADTYPEFFYKGITEEQAIELLKENVFYFQFTLNEILTISNLTINQNQYDALISFLYNLGHFTKDMENRFKAKDVNAIGNSLTLYTKVNGKDMEGLVKRRKAEQDLFFSKEG